MTDALDLPTVYDPKSVEPEIRALWDKGNYFHADPADPREPYVIVIPPPNVTGALHGGHALNDTLQDILIRWRRMQGHNTLWMPGVDHAGIATQAVVEKKIFETEKKSRHDLGREELVKRIWAWKEQYGNRIIEQLKLMGCSCDWERTRFTLDEMCARAVRHTFFKLFKDGLIVRGKRLVNWDTHLQTAVADDEVYHETVKGHLWHFRYPLEPMTEQSRDREGAVLQQDDMLELPEPLPYGRGSDGLNATKKHDDIEYVVVATTRPETMLGDTAVAVHPEPDKALDKLEAELRTQLAEAAEKEREPIQAQIDQIAERRTTLLPTLLKLRDMARDGRQVRLPLVCRPIPLICDEWAKPELGSGCVKITPAHDPNDYEVGQRHKLPMISVMTPDGKIADLSSHTQKTEVSQKLEGLKFATDGRKAVVAALEERGLVERIEDRQIELGHSDRSKTAIEPFLSDQWFVRMGDLTADDVARISSHHMREYAKSPLKEPTNEPRASACAVSPTRRTPSFASDAAASAKEAFTPAPSAAQAEARGSLSATAPLSYPGLAQLAMDAVCEKDHANEEERQKCGKVHFFPDRYAKTYLDWLGEKRDWCISRQLWWGHRIPVWNLYVPDRLPGVDTSSELTSLDANRRCANALIKELEDLFETAHMQDEFNIQLAENEIECTVLVCSRSEEADLLLAAMSAYYRNSVTDDEADSILRGSRLEQYKETIASIGGDLDGIKQDPDVLDTWFSSALWPHSTLGWPEQTTELAKYYPGSVLSTAREIITLWVARMVITGMYNLGKVPFHDVVIHAVIQDGQGRPFKKTLGNGFDPVDIIEFYGADALRFTMASCLTETQDIRMPMKKVKTEDGRELQSSERFELGRNFCNKLWNAARFAFITLAGTPPGSADESKEVIKEPRASARAASPTGRTPHSPSNPASTANETIINTPNAARAEARGSLSGLLRGSLSDLNLTALPIEDRWILSKISAATVEVQAALASFQFSKAVTLARDFFWDSVCDWYLELVKLRIRENRHAGEARQILAFVMDQSLRLLHPFVPFITERLWQQLNAIQPNREVHHTANAARAETRGSLVDSLPAALIVAAYPPEKGWPEFNNPAVEATFADLQNATRAVREVRQTQSVPPKQAVDITIKVPADRVASMRSEAHVIQHLANVGHVTIDPTAVAPKNSASIAVGDMQIFVHDVIDPAAERERLEKELANLDKQITSLSGKLANEGFIKNAKPEVIASERQRLADFQTKREQILSTAQALK